MMKTQTEDRVSQTQIAQLSGRLRADVLNGIWKPGYKLGIHALQAHYECGAGPLREALNRLVAQGLLLHLDQRGFVVAPVSTAELQDLVRTRIWVETRVLSDSISQGSIEWEEAVVLAWHRLSHKPRSLSQDPYADDPEWELLHRAFHHTLLSGCGSPLALQFCGELYDKAYRYRQIALSGSNGQRDHHKEHEKIVAAVIARDGVAACSLLEEHYRLTSAKFQLYSTVLPAIGI